MKLCSSCGVEKPTSEFYRNRTRPDGFSTNCKVCGDRWTWARKLQREYGITIAEYEAMVEAQGNLCAICGQPERARYRGTTPIRLTIDHCHETGKVRALLCLHCNTAIGKLQDDPALIRRAADYIESHR